MRYSERKLPPNYIPREYRDMKRGQDAMNAAPGTAMERALASIDAVFSHSLFYNKIKWDAEKSLAAGHSSDRCRQRYKKIADAFGAYSFEFALREADEFAEFCRQHKKELMHSENQFNREVRLLMRWFRRFGKANEWRTIIAQMRGIEYEQRI